MAENATPRPWKVDSFGDVVTASGPVVNVICECERPDAALIVRTVNAHDDLLAACKELREVTAAFFRAVSATKTSGEAIDRFELEIAMLGIKHGFGVRAQDAIAKAESR